MASISKYKTPTGDQRYRVMWRDPSGRQKSKSFDRYNKAKEFNTRLEHELRESSYVEPSKMTVRKFLASWLSVHKVNLQYKTIQGYEYNIGHINRIIGDTYLQRLTPGDIEKLYKSLPELSGKSLQEIHSTLNQALKYAVKTRVINSNPCDVVDRPKRVKFQAGFIEPNDVEKYLGLFRDCWMFPAVALGMFCGLRRGEIVALRWEDVRLRNGEIIVRHSLEEQDGKRVLKTPKSGKVRTVPIAAGVIDILKQQRKKQLEMQMFLGEEYRASDYVVTEDNGTQPALSYVSRFFNRRIKSSGIPHVRFHDLRHTAASLMLLEGADLKTVSDILGHSSISITADIYAHVFTESRKKAAESLEKYLK